VARTARRGRWRCIAEMRRHRPGFLAGKGDVKEVVGANQWQGDVLAGGGMRIVGLEPKGGVEALAVLAVLGATLFLVFFLFLFLVVSMAERLAGDGRIQHAPQVLQNADIGDLILDDMEEERGRILVRLGEEEKHKRVVGGGELL